MYKGVLTISKDQGDVAILFCDICDFDKIVVSERKNVIYLLDSLFRSFDKFCFNFKVQKIETVGKTYMACAGLKEYEHANLIDQTTAGNSATRVLSLAIEMMKHAKQYKWGSPLKDLQLRIGIHSGCVLAGVIGFHKPQFSLIGDTVNTTSRVCSTGNNGKIMISEDAYLQLNEKFLSKFEFAPKTVEAKGKGTLKTYQLENVFKSENQIEFNKNLCMSSPKHSFFKSSTKKMNTLMNFSLEMTNFKDEERKHEKKELNSLPELKLNFGVESKEPEREIIKPFEVLMEKKQTFIENKSVIVEENESLALSQQSIKKINERGVFQESENFNLIFSGSNENHEDNLNNLNNLGDFQLIPNNIINENNEEVRTTPYIGMKLSRTKDNKKTLHSEDLRPLTQIFPIKRGSLLEDSKEKDWKLLKRTRSYPIIKDENDFKAIFARVLEMLTKQRKSYNKSTTENNYFERNNHRFSRLKPHSSEEITGERSSESNNNNKSNSKSHRNNNNSNNIIHNNGFQKLEVIDFEDITENNTKFSQENVEKSVKEIEISQKPLENKSIDLENKRPSENPFKSNSLLISNFELSLHEFEDQIPKRNSKKSIFHDSIVENKKKIAHSRKNSNEIRIQSYQSLDNLEEIEEYYECVLKKPQIIKQNKTVRREINDNSGIDFVNVNEEKSKGFLKEHKFWLSFSSDQKVLSETFEMKNNERNLPAERVYLGVLCFFLMPISLFHFFLENHVIYVSHYTISNLLVFLILCVCVYFRKKLGRYFKIILVLVVFLQNILIVIYKHLNEEYYFLIPELIVFFNYYVISQLSIMKFKEIFFISLMYLSLQSLMVYKYENSPMLISTSFFVCSLNLSLIHMKKKMEIDYFNKNRNTELEKKRLNEIIQYLLPPHVNLIIYN